MIFTLSGFDVFAGGGGGHHGDRHHHDRGWYGGWNLGYHHPRGYHYYRNNWWLGDAIVTSLALGTVLTSLPPSYRLVYINGYPYYYDGLYYYQAAPEGYVVVNPTIVQASPVIVQTPVETGVITINVPNSDGSFTPVVLTRRGDGYLGPQGEYYQAHPSVEQLRALYGK
jgi:hypothetical protein